VRNPPRRMTGMIAASAAGAVFMIVPAAAFADPDVGPPAAPTRPAAPTTPATAPAPQATPAPSSTTPASTTAEVPVSQGIGPAALPKTVFGPTSPATRETVSFILTERHGRLLAAQVEAGMPGGYLSVRKFAAQYGQPAAQIQALRRYLAGFGIASTAAADGLDVTARGTAGNFDHALSVQQHQYVVARVPASNSQAARPAVQIHGTTDRPLLPASLASFVVSILGLTNYPTFASNAVHKLPLAQNVRPSAVQTGSLTPAAFATRYGLRPLQLRGALGQGQTIGIVSLASMRLSDPYHFWSTNLRLRTLRARIRLVNVDGGAGPVSDAAGSGETTLDVEQSGALAPDSRVVVYQAPNTDAGFMDGYVTAAGQDQASTVSASWGESETYISSSVADGQESASYARSFDEIYLELAAQGQTSFTAAGDYGAYDAHGDLGSTNLSVDNPADSPWTTVAGGTTLPGTIPLAAHASASIAVERTWGADWLWPYFRLFTDAATGQPYTSEAAFIPGDISGGGGGVSRDEPIPAYQAALPGSQTFSAVPYLIPRGYTIKNGMTLPMSWALWNHDVTPSTPPPAIVSGLAHGRELPDLVADADPYTGYQEFFTGFPGAHLQAGWGGTSFVAPQLAGSAAVIDSYLGRRTGFWNPVLYRVAGRAGSPFRPLDAAGAGNDDLYYTGTPRHVYNVGSGLGTPDLAALARDFIR
jgi:kumamolisin